jgi:hypothetical protein
VLSSLSAAAGAAGNPIALRERRTRARSTGTPIVIALWLTATAGAALVLFGLAAEGAPDHHPNAAQMARAAYHVLSLQLGLVMVGGALLGAASISRERERGTFDLLLGSDLTPWQVVGAKARANVGFLLQLVVAALPLHLAFFLHAGLSAGDLLVAELVTLGAAVTATSLGLLLSALCPRTPTAVLAAGGLVLALCLDAVLAGVVPVPGTGLPQTRRQLLDGSFGVEVPFNDDVTRAAAPGAPQSSISPLRLANPLYAAHTQLAGPPGREASLGVARLVPGGRGDGGIRIRPWHLSLAASGLASLLLLAMTTRLVGTRP